MFQALQLNSPKRDSTWLSAKMTAPSDGYVVNWQVQEGTMLVPMPTAAAGTFIDTTSISVLAAFPQNYPTNVQPGDMKWNWC